MFKKTCSHLDGNQALQPAALPVNLACQYLGCGRSTLYILLAQGRVKSVVHKTHKSNVRGRRVFLRDSLDTYLESLEGGVAQW